MSEARTCRYLGCGQTLKERRDYQGGTEWWCMCCTVRTNCIHIEATKELERRKKAAEIDEFIKKHTGVKE